MHVNESIAISSPPPLFSAFPFLSTPTLVMQLHLIDGDLFNFFIPWAIKINRISH